jgi:hypothetical protein
MLPLKKVPRIIVTIRRGKYSKLFSTSVSYCSRDWQCGHELGNVSLRPRAKAVGCPNVGLADYE